MGLYTVLKPCLKGENTNITQNDLKFKFFQKYSFLFKIIIIIIDRFCKTLFSGVPKLTALYNILQHFLSFTNIIHIIMTTNNV